MMNKEKSIELATSPKGYKLILVDGRLMIVLANGRQLELHLEKFMNFNWKANAYGKYAIELNILYYSLKGKSLREAMTPLMGYLNERPLEYLMGIRFAVVKNGELYPFLTDWK
jgi:hypothetical protein